MLFFGFKLVFFESENDLCEVEEIDLLQLLTLFFETLLSFFTSLLFLGLASTFPQVAISSFETSLSDFRLQDPTPISALPPTLVNPRLPLLAPSDPLTSPFTPFVFTLPISLFVVLREY